MRYPFVRHTPTFEERAQGVLSMLKSNASRVKDLDLEEFKSAFKDIDWKSFRDVDFRGIKDGLKGNLKDVDPSAVFAAGAGVFEGMKHMRRDHEAERRNSGMFAAVGAAAVGAAFMYFFDPEHGESRRSSARERLKQWYLSGRGQLDHGWRQLQSESPGFDLAEKVRSGGDPADTHNRTPHGETAALPARKANRSSEAKPLTPSN